MNLPQRTIVIRLDHSIVERFGYRYPELNLTEIARDDSSPLHNVAAILVRGGISRLDRLFPRTPPEYLHKSFLAANEGLATIEIPHLQSYYQFDVPVGQSPEPIIASLLAEERVVRSAYVAPIMEEDPVSTIPREPISYPFAGPIAARTKTLDYSAAQFYRQPAPIGINADGVVNIAGSGGTDVSLVDIEVDWLVNHEEFVAKANIFKSVIQDDPLKPDYAQTVLDGLLKGGQHGTATLGVICAASNKFGVTGIATKVRRVLCATTVEPISGRHGQVANAITEASQFIDDGDVILIEAQFTWPYTGLQYMPVEYAEAERDAIRTYSKRFLIVEAAGNGNHYLDATPKHLPAGYVMPIMNTSDPNYRDSGALMVGYCEAAEPHVRSGVDDINGPGSNHGSRIDCFAWGHQVMTSGWPDHKPDLGIPNDVYRSYTIHFRGSSAASAIIAGVALSAQGMALKKNGIRLGAQTLRSLLKNPNYGTLQGGDVATDGNIGVMPDLLRVYQNLP